MAPKERTTPIRLRGCILLPPAPWPHGLTLSGVGTVVNLAFTAASTRNVTVTVPSNCRPLGSRPSIREEARHGTVQDWRHGRAAWVGQR